MTVTLELKPGVEAAATAEAKAQGIAIENYLQAFLEKSLPRPSEDDSDGIRKRRMEILSRLQGKYAGLPGGSEVFAASKEEEKALEERHWQSQA